MPQTCRHLHAAGIVPDLSGGGREAPFYANSIYRNSANLKCNRSRKAAARVQQTNWKPHPSRTKRNNSHGSPSGLLEIGPGPLALVRANGLVSPERLLAQKPWPNTFRRDRILSSIEVPDRKYYATRHTFITEMVKKNINVKAIADYVGNFSGDDPVTLLSKLELDPNEEVFEKSASNTAEYLASPTGFEPVLSA